MSVKRLFDFTNELTKKELPCCYSIHVETTFATRHSPSSFSNVAW